MSYTVIFCEGITDRVFLGSFLKSSDLNCNEISGYEDLQYEKIFDGTNKYNKRVDYYSYSDRNYVAVCEVGGCNFLDDVKYIFAREILEHKVDKIIIVTDHDEENECKNRCKDIFDGISRIDGVKTVEDQNNEKHRSFVVKNQFEVATIDILFVDIPLNSMGNLETLVLDCICKPTRDDSDSVDRKYVKEESKSFVEKLDKKKCLKSRRDQIKAPLGVAIALLNPGRALCTMKQLIDSIDFEQFKDLKELMVILDFINDKELN